eukprot:gnl/MRDRNA2_/MRDRNA2_84976_c0_seq2.p1 gnl/MRDRNA2_/MRDRNA2_84976_c0~~gnl/MRDRNA2_/MRDRNA2_84976_c0_seq2.p1  ORF type:complete len:178 (+),score=28.10 gnl/MRDRNA2_/MRDRNA2_84976_c0_seq2:372-905(+)
MSDKRVIELGAGCGLLGISIAVRSEARKVVLTDMQDICPLLRANVAANFGSSSDEMASIRPVVEPLDWSSADDLLRVSSKGPYDVVLGADIVYCPESYPALLDTLEGLVLGKVILAIARRNCEEETFLKLGRERGWQFQLVREVTPKRSFSNHIWIFESGPPVGVERPAKFLKIQNA